MVNELTPQQTRALDFRKSLSLKANAGSGKTFVLAKRYIQIALKGNIPLRRIAAITFTEKAAGELYKRIADEIDSAMNHASSISEIKSLEKIRRQLVSANISTIHSFCNNILKEYPVEAEIDANFSPIDQKTANELMELAVEETLLRRLDDAENDDCKYLIRLFGSKNNLANQLRVMINSRKIVTLLAEELYSKNAETIGAHFSDKFTQYFKIIFDSGIKKFIADLSKINNAVLGSDSKNETAIAARKLISDFSLAEDIAGKLEIINKIKDVACTKALRLKTRGYLGSGLKDIFGNEINEVELFLNHIKHILLSDNSSGVEFQLAITGKYLIDLFQDTLLIYDQRKQEKGYLDYEDMLLKTRMLLQKENTAKLLSQKYDYLMVDEYQDTNEIQYEIFLPVLDYLKQGNLFVVGDDKQSIYRFREADLDVFEKTNLIILQQSGNDYMMTLPDSFRMDPVICLFTNLLFKELFSNPDKLFNEVAHSDLVCAKQEKTGGEVSILIPENDSGISEIELIARQILKLIYNEENNIGWKDIAILVRKRDAFKDIEKKFIERNIPFRIIGGRGFFQRQSIYDIFNYFSFILNTNNDAALVGILRSPFFLVSDLKLFEISLNDGNSFWEKMQNSEADENLVNIVSQLKNSLSLSDYSDFSAILRKIFEDTDYIAVLASRPDGEQELANIEKLQRLTNSFTAQGFRTLYDYVDFLKDAISKHDDESQESLADQADAVNILTIHQAKGLEYPSVFLYKCHESSREDNIKSKSIKIDKRFGILTKVPKGDNFFGEYKSAPVVAIRDYIDSRENIAETKRLFYVAVTRAKQYLYLSAESVSKSFPSSSFIGMLIEGLKIDINEAGYSISGDLKYLIKNGNAYSTVEKLLQYKIQIVKNLSSPDEISFDGKKNNDKKIFILNEITDNSKGEIISATKVATFMQCPLKYNLIYRYGYLSLHSEFNNSAGGELLNSDKYHEEKNSDDNNDYDFSSIANYKGQIIHLILQKEIEMNRVEQFILEQLDSLNIDMLKDAESKNLFSGEIMKLITSYYESEEYKTLRSFNNYKNEAEIYLSEKDYFLYGIIDKLIIDGKNLIIIDYKTDDIVVESIKDRADYYLNQLNFYVHLASKFHKEFEQIEIRIIFLKHPDNSFSKVYNSNDIKIIENEVGNSIQGILSAVSSKNLQHCRQCNFYINNNCIS